MRPYNPSRNNSLYNRRKALGLCVRCGADNVAPYAVCRACRIKMSEYMVRAHLKQVAERRCRSCGKPLPDGYDRVTCKTCIDRIHRHAVERRLHETDNQGQSGKQEEP